MKKQSIKRGVWGIGGRQPRKQTSGFFPIIALAGPLLGGVASSLAGPIFKKLIRVKIDHDDDNLNIYIKKWSETIF